MGTSCSFLFPCTRQAAGSPAVTGPHTARGCCHHHVSNTTCSYQPPQVTTHSPRRVCFAFPGIPHNRSLVGECELFKPRLAPLGGASGLTRFLSCNCEKGREKARNGANHLSGRSTRPAEMMDRCRRYWCFFYAGVKTNTWSCQSPVDKVLIIHLRV